MAEPKTKQTKASVSAFLNAIPEEGKRKDSKAIAKMMQKVSGEKPYMWGTSIVGFGKFHYKYASGHEGDTCIVGFSPRKQNLTLYLYPGFHAEEKLLSKLGKFKLGKGCLYINKLSDVDTTVLEDLVAQAVRKMKTLKQNGIQSW